MCMLTTLMLSDEDKKGGAASGKPKRPDINNATKKQRHCTIAFRPPIPWYIVSQCVCVRVCARVHVCVGACAQVCVCASCVLGCM